MLLNTPDPRKGSHAVSRFTEGKVMNTYEILVERKFNPTGTWAAVAPKGWQKIRIREKGNCAGSAVKSGTAWLSLPGCEVKILEVWRVE
jgi:hypothetical protein